MSRSRTEFSVYAKLTELDENVARVDEASIPEAWRDIVLAWKAKYKP